MLSGVWCRLCDEFEEIAQRALTTPTSTKELMELKSYVQKFELETMCTLERRLSDAKTTLAFLIEHTNFSSAEMCSNAETFTWYERMPDIVSEHRAIIAEKQTQFEEALKVRLHVLYYHIVYYACDCRNQLVIINICSRLFCFDKSLV